MWDDLKFALGLFRRAPAFAAAVVLTLAVGLGSLTATFALLDAFLLRPPPLVADPARVVRLSESFNSRPDRPLGISYPDFDDIRRRAPAFSSLAACLPRTVILGAGVAPLRVLGTDVSPAYFSVFGVRPRLGRDFTATDAAPDAPRVALISDSLWRDRFDASSAILDSTIDLNGRPTQVIGILPPAWRDPFGAEAWQPLRLDPAQVDATRGTFFLEAVARLAPGATPGSAQAELDRAMADLAIAHPATNRDLGIRLLPLRADLFPGGVTAAVTIAAAALLVFLLACINASNLVLARATARAREFAVRAALGASPRRLVLQNFAESLLLGLAGGAVGLLAALWLVDSIAAVVPAGRRPFWLDFHLDARVLGFAAAASLLAGLLCALAPARQIARAAWIDDLGQSGRVALGGGRRTRRVRGLMVAFELAAALVLMLGASLLFRQLLASRAIPVGFEPRPLLVFRTGIPEGLASGPGSSRRFFDHLRGRLAALPAVDAVALTNAIPGTPYTMDGAFAIAGRPPPASLADAISARYRAVTPSYFDTFGIPLLRGRAFTAGDTGDVSDVCLIDEAFARRWFPGEDPLGQQLTYAFSDDPAPKSLTIAGVVGSVRESLDLATGLGSVYVPLGQTDASFLHVAVRTRAGDPRELLPAIESTVASVDPRIPIYQVTTMPEILAASIWSQSFFTRLFGGLAISAILLAAVGVHGLTAYAVAQRTRELGLRAALGAPPRELIRLVLRQASRLVALGLAAGLVLALPAAHWLTRCLPGLATHDLLLLFTTPALLALITFAACYQASRRAAAIDPIDALRGE